MTLYFYLVLIILMSSINPYIKKQLTKKIDKYTFIALTSVFIFCINMIYIFYNTFKIDNLKNVTNIEVAYCFTSAFLSIAPSIIFLNLIQSENVNSLTPIIRPLGILVTTLFGIFLFNEKMSHMQIIGGLIILIGTGIFLIKDK